MEKLSHVTESIIDENVERLAALFPEVVTEVREPDGTLRHAIDVDALRERVGDVAEGQRERYQFTWPGKREAKQEAYRQIDKCLRPCPEESVKWDTTQNLYIEGDNLDALKLLRNTYAGKVKMIYIDPPYNTGHDFIYDDDFAQTKADYDAESGDYDEEGGRLVANPESNGRFHSDWCSMMYPRLLLARDLLSDDGVIFTSISRAELESLGLLLRETFGTTNEVACLTWESVTQPTNAGAAKYGAQQKSEFIYLFSRFGRRSFVLPIEEVKVGDSRYPHNGRFGKCRFEIIEKSDAGTYGRESMKFDILGQGPRPGKRWQIGEETARDLEKRGRLEIVDGIVKKAVYPEDEADKEKVTPFWTHLPSEKVGTAQSGKKELNELLEGEIGFDTVKPVTLLQYLIGKVETDSIVLDFFSGSATTAHAVMQLNAEDGGSRKFIMVQLPEACDEKSEAVKAGYKTICEIGKERIRRAGKKIAAEVEESNCQLKLGEEPKKVPDIGFRVLKIDSSNFEDVSAEPGELSQGSMLRYADNLKLDRTPDDLIIQVMLKKQIELSASIEKLDVDGCTVFSVDGGRLIACFDRDVSVEVMTAMAKMEPDYAVMRDASFAGDDAVSNFAEIFKNYSSITEVEVI